MKTKHTSMSRSLLCLLALTILCYISDAKSIGLPIKRIFSEWKSIYNSKIDLSNQFSNDTVNECGVRLSPLKSNILEWHFSFSGLEGSNYDGGIYHGKIRLNPDYPQKAPTISLLTPSGRWEVKTDICLSATAHHQELWDPNWNMRTLILSLRGFMTTQPGEIGSVHSDSSTQQLFAKLSRTWKCPECGADHRFLSGMISTCDAKSMHKLYLPDDDFFVKFSKANNKKKTKSNHNANNVTTMPSKSILEKLLSQEVMRKIKLLAGLVMLLCSIEGFRKIFQ